MIFANAAMIGIILGRVAALILVYHCPVWIATIEGIGLSLLVLLESRALQFNVDTEIILEAKE